MRKKEYNHYYNSVIRLLGSITFISMSNKIQNWVDALCDGRLKSLLAIFTNDFTVFLQLLR